MLDANNFYSLNTATTIVNSGTGSNSLTKPAGEEVASIVPGKKYSVYIPSAATFTTNFNSDLDGYTIFMCAKPNAGEVLSFAGNSLVYTGESFTMANEVGDALEIPVRDERAHIIFVTVSDMEIGVFVDGLWASIDANTVDGIGQIPVSVLAAGGIVDHIGAKKGVLSTVKIIEATKSYLSELPPPPDTMKMLDRERDFVSHINFADRINLVAGESREMVLPNGIPMAFRIEYSVIGDVGVVVNGITAESGMVFEGEPDTMAVMSMTGGRLEDVVVTEYHSSNMGAMAFANIYTDASSGIDAPTHVQSDSACNSGETTVEVIDSANTVAGWFYAVDGSPLPGASMSGGVLTGTGLHVNGKPYSGQPLRGWYFLAKTGTVTGAFVIDVPVHSLTITDQSLTASQIDDLYESFFGNPTAFAGEEGLSISEGQVFLISTEWNIVTSG